MKRSKIRTFIALICNTLTVVLVTYSIARFFIASGVGNMSVSGTRCFRFYTVDSNILAAIASAVMIPFLLKSKTPLWVLIIKFVGTVAVTVTFLTVVFFLGPTQGYDTMFSGISLYLHLICPLLSLLSFLLPETDAKMPPKAWLWGISTVFIYACVYLVMVVIVPSEYAWPDFYGFNRGGFWYISFAAMHIFGAVLSFGISSIRGRTLRSDVKQSL